MKKRTTKGRRVPDRQIAGDAPRLLNIPDSAKADLLVLMREVESIARASYAAHGRGFLFWVNYPDRGIAPAVMYCATTSTQYRDFSAERDLVDAVHSYDPGTQFVVLEGEFDDVRGALQDVQISIMGFQYTDGAALSA